MFQIELAVLHPQRAWRAKWINLNQTPVIENLIQTCHQGSLTDRISTLICNLCCFITLHGVQRRILLSWNTSFVWELASLQPIKSRTALSALLSPGGESSFHRPMMQQTKTYGCQLRMCSYEAWKSRSKAHTSRHLKSDVQLGVDDVDLPQMGFGVDRRVDIRSVFLDN